MAETDYQSEESLTSRELDKKLSRMFGIGHISRAKDRVQVSVWLRCHVQHRHTVRLFRFESKFGSRKVWVCHHVDLHESKYWSPEKVWCHLVVASSRLVRIGARSISCSHTPYNKLLSHISLNKLQPFSSESCMSCGVIAISMIDGELGDSERIYHVLIWSKYSLCVGLL